MKKYLYILVLLVFTSCRAFIGGGGPPGSGNRVIFNICSNNNDSCRCKANKFKLDSNLGYHCRPIDSAKITLTRRGNESLAFTDSMGLSNSINTIQTRQRFYFIKPGYPVVSTIVNFNPKSKMLVQASGCEVYAKRLMSVSGSVYYVSVVIKPNPKKGVKLVPYKPSGN